MEVFEEGEETILVLTGYAKGPVLAAWPGMPTAFQARSQKCLPSTSGARLLLTCLGQGISTFHYFCLGNTLYTNFFFTQFQPVSLFLEHLLLSRL